MNSKNLTVAVLLPLSLLVLFPGTGLAASETEISNATEDGIEWLLTQQNPDGSWGSASYSKDKVGITSFAVLVLTDATRALDEDPLDGESSYYENISDGVEYITNSTVNASLVGDAHETYNRAIALMALANLNDPDYADYVENTVDWFIERQNDDGGWRYPGYTTSDNSHTGYVIIALAYAEEAGYEVGAVREGLDSWIDYIQNDVDGDSLDGGSGYDGPNSWVTILETGNLVYEMGFVGDPPTSERLEDALDFIARHWEADGSYFGAPGWSPGLYYRYNYQGMYCCMKGLEYYGIETLENNLENNGGDIYWYEDLSDAIVETQAPEGYWSGDTTSAYEYGGLNDRLLATEWALLTLKKVVPPPPPPENGGWYFFSIPFKLAEPDVDLALEGVDYDVLLYYNASSGLFEGVSELEPLKGYWIHVLSDSEFDAWEHFEALDQEIPAAPGTLEIYPGWNAVGSPAMESLYAEVAFDSIDYCYTKIMGPWVPEGEYGGYYEYVGYNGLNGTLNEYHVGTDIFYVDPYEGYWILRPENCTLA